jgi:DNA repair protein SbcC/Rad50
VKITEFSIDKYGPLARTGKITPGAFTLFFGKNEHGKTLTIDALIKFLIGKKIKDFKADRVDGDPDGYLKIALNENTKEKKEKTLPYDGDLSKITKSLSSQLTSSDCRNIFIIRNSDLSLSGEAEFYTGITERLVGLRTSDIKKIKRNLLEIGRLTPAMDFRNDEKSLRLKTRIENAEKLIIKIENLKDNLLKGEYDKLEVRLYKNDKELSGINERIIFLEDAKKRAMFEKGSELLHALENTISALKGMEIFREEDFEQWQNSEREIKRSEREINELHERAADIQKDLSVKDGQLKESRQNLEIMNSKKRHLDDEKLNLRGLENSLSVMDSDASIRGIMKRISILSTFITFALITTSIYSPSIYLYFAGTVSLVITLILWIYEIYLNFKKRKALKGLGKIKISLAENRINGDTIEDIFNSMGKFNEDYERIIKRNGQFESDLLTLQRHLKETENKIQDHRVLTDNYEKKVFSLKTKSGFKTLQEYSELLKSKSGKEKERDAIANRIEGMLEVHGKSMGETLSLVRSKIFELDSYKEKGKGIEFNEKNYDDLRNKSKVCEDEIKKVKEKIDLFENGMAKIEADANDIFLEDNDKSYCKTFIELDKVLTRLKNFIEENTKKRNTIINAIQILDEIDKDENKRVLELFDSGLSNLFNTITNGNYNKVIFDKEDGVIKVERNNGDLIEAEKLSGGAYDQLYLSIRIALGEKLLQSEKGFFIFDDPFIKSDIDRIEKQINVLKKICEMGWQILYFSCKNEIKDILSTDIKNNIIGFVAIDWVNN